MQSICTSRFILQKVMFFDVGEKSQNKIFTLISRVAELIKEFQNNLFEFFKLVSL